MVRTSYLASSELPLTDHDHSRAAASAVHINVAESPCSFNNWAVDHLAVIRVAASESACDSPSALFCSTHHHHYQRTHSCGSWSMDDYSLNRFKSLMQWIILLGWRSRMSPESSSVEGLVSNAAMSRCGAFQKWLDHEASNLMSKSMLSKKCPAAFVHVCLYVPHNKK